MHAYEKIPLHLAGYVLAAFIIITHLWMIFKQDDATDFLRKFPRNSRLGAILMGLGMFGFWLIVAPSGVSPLSIDLNDFNNLKKFLVFLVPIVAIFVIMEVKEFLSIRGLGLCLLILAAPLLGAAWQEPFDYKFLVPLYAYGMITAGLFFVGMPYLCRDIITWATASKSRFKLLSTAGLIYGIAVLGCSITLWS